MTATLRCLRVVLPDDTFVVGFHLQLRFGPYQSYIPVRYRPAKYYTIGAAKMLSAEQQVLLVRGWWVKLGFKHF